MTFNGTKLPLKRFRSLSLLAMASAASLLSGCLDRPVGRTKPETNNIFVKQNPSGGIDKIDILFMVDNSLSMGDKQAVLAAAVPQLLTRLTNPDCIATDETTGTITRTTMPTPTDNCATGTQREFAPVKDIHIGVVTSSLGDYGGDVCPETPAESSTAGFPDQNDHGWLLGALPRVAGLGLDPAGFLSWTKENAAAYGSVIAGKTDEFRNFVTATGEIGCGLEMALESWYRFLVDPKPPLDVISPGGGYSQRAYQACAAGDTACNPADSNGLGDTTILSLRKAFLRSDSLVAVVMLGDENDCSLKDTRSYSWVPATSASNFRMWRASAKCAENPNDKCCFSCMMVGVDSSIPAECLAADPTCKQDAASKMALADDQTGLRCKNMKQRFGFDFLFPVARYANALTKLKICPDSPYGDLDCDCAAAKAKDKDAACEPGEPRDNPLYDNLDLNVVPTGPDRDKPDAVFFAGIVGVPWQDLATDAVVAAYAQNPAADATSLEYKKATELNWDWFAPIDDFTAPADPYMIETTEPRQGSHPHGALAGNASFALQPPTAARGASLINGHEWNTGRADLQFACTFSLEQPITSATSDETRNCVAADYCAGATDAVKCAREFVGCSCKGAADPTAYTENSPLCQKADGSYTTTQTGAKAYPCIRQLQTLRMFYEQTGKSNNAIVGSICPKDLTYAKRTEGGYGYNPAVASLVDRLKEKLGGVCLPRPLIVDKATGTVPCVIAEVIHNDAANSAWCNCEANLREPVEPAMVAALKTGLQRENKCGNEGQISCDEFCFCKLPELKPNSPEGDQCLTEPNREKNAIRPGFCYVDPAQAPAALVAGESSIVAGCPAAQKRLIRIVGGDGVTVKAAPAPGYVFIACSGGTYDE